MLYLAVDIGSSFIKTAVCDLRRLEMGFVTKADTPEAMEPRGPGYFELDPELLFRTVAGLVDAQLQRFPVIQGILISTQMHGFVLTDRSGLPVTPYISWQDERCLEPCADGSGTYLERLQRSIPGELLRPAGVPLKPGLALCNLCHLLERHGSEAQTDKIRFCTLGAFVIQRLTGSHVCHASNAAATGLWNIVEEDWNYPLIRHLGCEGLSFPAVRPATEAAGYYRTEASQAVPVYPDIGDHQAAVLGSFAAPGRDVVVSVGTAGLMSRITEPAAGGNFEVRPYFEGSCLHTVTRLPGGRNLDVLIRFVQAIGERVFGLRADRGTVWERMLHLLQEAGGPTGLTVKLGFFPFQQGVAEGSIERIDEGNLQPDQLLLAAIGNLAEVYNGQLGKLCPDRAQLERLVLTGGAAWKIGPLAEALSYRSGCPAVLAPLPDEPLIGLFRLALISAGVCRDLTDTERLLLMDETDRRSVIRINI